MLVLMASFGVKFPETQDWSVEVLAIQLAIELMLRF